MNSKLTSSLILLLVITLVSTFTSAANITLAPSQTIGQIRDDFYGVNSREYPSINTIVNNSVLSQSSNATWHEEKLQQAGVKELRRSMFLTDTALSNGKFVTSGYSDIRIVKDMVNYSYRTNGKILLIVDNIPSWEQNRTSGYCNSTAWHTCPPFDNSSFSDTVLAYINNVTNNGEWNRSVEIQIMNEIESKGFWLCGLSETAGNSTIRSIEYNKMYNRTYDAIKTTYPNMPVGMYSGSYQMFTSIGLPILQGFLSNFSNKMDFFSYNDYLDANEGNFNTQIQNDYTKIISNCTAYSANCSRILFGEFNIYNSTMLNNSAYNRYVSSQMGLAYLGALNNYPNRTSMMPYTWSWRRMFNDSLYAGDSPYDFRIVSEPFLDNTLKPAFSIMSNMSTYCPSNGFVLNSSSDNSNISSVLCQDRTGLKTLVVINTINSNQNVSIPSLSSSYKLQDLGLGTEYSLQSGSALVQLGAYNVSYFQQTGCQTGYILDTDGITCIAGEGKVKTWDTFSRAILKLVVGFIALLILVMILAGAWIYFKSGFIEQADIYTVVKIGVIALVLIILGSVLFDFIWGML